MARAKTNKIFRTFVKGLMTEASYLTYPEDYSTDELNTVISRKGNRTRRLGVDYENDYQTHTLINNETDRVSEFVWMSADNKANRNFLVLQGGRYIYFYNLEAVPVSDSRESFFIDLNTYKTESATTTDVRENNAEFSSGEGFLFIVHPFVEPLLVEYDHATNTIEVTRIIIQMRDFTGIHDSLANDEEPTTLSKEHHYNLLNQGWLTPNPITPPGGVVPDAQPTYTNPYTGTTSTYRRFNDNNTQIP